MESQYIAVSKNIPGGLLQLQLRWLQYAASSDYTLFIDNITINGSDDSSELCSTNIHIDFSSNKNASG